MIMIRSTCEHCKHCLSCMCGDEFKDCKLKKSKKDGDIDERAVAFGEMLLSYGESEDSASSGASGYMIGARTQRAIDAREFLDKACHYLRKEYEQMNTLIRAVCDREVGDLIDIDASVKTFIKMMKK